MTRHCTPPDPPRRARHPHPLRPVQRDAGVLDDVVEHGGEALTLGMDAECHAERMEDVRLAGLVALAAVEVRREDDCVLDGHDAFHRIIIS